MDNRKVLIIGLDGFTWQIGNKLIDEGYMPTLFGLRNKGCYGNLKSVIPYETSPAWSSFQTGCLPGKTGVFTFHSFHRSLKKIRLNNHNDILVPSIWQLASEAGKKVVCINLPMTSPPPKIDGIIIPGLTCPAISPETVYPPEAYARYLQNLSGYTIVDQQERNSLQEYVDAAITAEQTRCDVSLKIMKEMDWDVFCVEMQSTDFFQHRNWWSLDPSARGYSEEAFLTASSFYSNVDMMIKRFVESAGEEAVVFIVSDHGFCKKHAEIRINSWLAENGYLALNEMTKGHKTTIKEKLKTNIPILKKAAMGYGKISKPILQLIKKNPAKLNAEVIMKHAREIVDLQKTSAFCLGGMAGLLYISHEHNHLEKEITDKLLAAFGPNSANPLISEINSGRSLYQNDRISEIMPDVVVSLFPGVVNHIEPNGPIISSGDHNGKQTGTHAREGVFVISGPDILNGHQMDASIVDIAPTVLSKIKVPIPNYMDGKVMQEAFKSSLEANYANRSIDEGVSEKKIYSNEEQSEVEKQLRDLGYL